jgi:hypothetical protein
MPGRKKFWTDHNDATVRRLEEIRQSLAMSMREMAEALDVPFRTYQKWVYSRQKPRHPGELIICAEALIAPRRINCWEYLRCGREPGGDDVGSDGPCPAALDRMAEGVNSGVRAGRVCWAVSGTFCGTRAQGTEASKMISCLNCGFFTRVLREEGLANFKLLRLGQTYTQQ